MASPFDRKGVSPFNRTSALRAWANDPEDRHLNRGAPTFARAASDKVHEEASRKGEALYRFRIGQKVRANGKDGTVDGRDQTRAGANRYSIKGDGGGSFMALESEISGR